MTLTSIGAINTFAQDSICKVELVEGGGFNPVESNDQARNILNEVMRAAGVDPKTVGIRAAKVKDAIACEDKESGKRYILFNPEWLNGLGENARTDWVARAILAHEVGHHKKAHWIQLRLLDFCAPELEAQADEVAGETLARIGGTLEEAQSAYRAIVRESNSDCYPSKSERLKFVKVGWEKIKAIELMKLYERKNSLEEYFVDENIDKQIYYAGVVIRYEHTDEQYFDPTAYLLRARALYENTKAPEAIGDLKEYLKYNPLDSDIYILLAKYTWFAEDVKATIENLNQAIKLNPTSPKPYAARAEMFFERGKYALALADVNKALEVDPNFSWAHLIRGHIFEKEGELDAALLNANKAIELNSKDSFSYQFRADVFKQKGDPDSALVDYTKAIELDPSASEAYQGRAKIYRAQNRTALAEADESKSVLTLQILRFTKLIDNNPKAAGLYGLRGYLFMRSGKLDDALADFTKAIEMEPASYLYRRRASIFGGRGNLDAALADYTKAIELNPEEVDSYHGRAKIYRARNKNALAEADEKTVKELQEIYN